jgi:hypothetical protein
MRSPVTAAPQADRTSYYETGGLTTKPFHPLLPRYSATTAAHEPQWHADFVDAFAASLKTSLASEQTQITQSSISRVSNQETLECTCSCLPLASVRHTETPLSAQASIDIKWGFW